MNQSTSSQINTHTQSQNTPGPPEHDLTIKPTLPLNEQIELDYEKFFSDTSKSVAKQLRKTKKKKVPTSTRHQTLSQTSDDDEPNKKSTKWTDEIDMELESKSEISDQFQTPARTSRQPTKTVPDQIKTTNKFDTLRKTSQDINQSSINSVINQKHTSRTWIPPIVLPYAITNYSKIITELRATLKHDNFSLKYGRNNTRIYTHSIQDHDILQEDFKTHNYEYHTYTRHENKSKKIVLKAAPGIDTLALQNTLKTRNIDVNGVVPLKGKEDSSFSYLVSVPLTTKINDIRQINNIENLKVTWQKYVKNTNYTQCYRCQDFGHGQSTCHREFKCVRCPEKHNYKDCPNKNNPKIPPVCSNCAGPHTANYSKCPYLLRYLQLRVNSRQANTQQTQQNATQPKTFIQTHIDTRTFAQASNNTRTANTQQQQEYKNYTDYTRDFPTLPSKNYSNTHTQNTQAYPQTQEDIFSTIKNLRQDNDIQDIIRLINLIMKMKQDLQRATTGLDKLQILTKYIELF